MVAFLLSYHRVSPRFLDLILPFGKQIGAQYNGINGVRDESLFPKHRELHGINVLGRSGTELRISYNLASVEEIPQRTHMPWSIHHTAVYHSVDMFTGHIVWMNIQSSEVLKNRIEAATTIANLATTTNSALDSSLMTHTVFVEWAGENWRWYIDDLEASVHEKTAKIVDARVEAPKSDYHPQNPSRTTTSSLNHTNDVATQNRSAGSVNLNTRKSLSMTRSVYKNLNDGETTHPDSHRQSQYSTEISFDDLQRVQWLEEQVDESVLVLSMNLVTLKGLKDIYVKHGRLVPSITKPFSRELYHGMTKFCQQIGHIEQDLETQVIRSKTLLKKLHDRKALVCHVRPSMHSKSPAKFDPVTQHPRIPQCKSQRTLCKQSPTIFRQHAHAHNPNARNRPTDPTRSSLHAHHHASDVVLSSGDIRSGT
jgi:hypothetical protein